MDKNLILGTRFKYFSKYVGIISAICFVAFIILNAINTNNGILYWICYTLIMVALVGGLQAIILFALGKFYLSKVKK